MRTPALFLVLLSNGVFACSELNWDWGAAKWVSEPTAIYHGMVASISLSSQSIYDGETDPLRNILALRGERNINFKVFETLKGNETLVVTAVLPECIGGVAEFGDTAILFKVGGAWHIKPLQGDYANETASKVLRRLSTIRHSSELQP
jgi:hypothetical protein